MGSSLPSASLAPYDRDLTLGVVINGRRAEVPAYRFMEKFLFVQDEEGRKVPFRLREEQADLYREICLQRREGKPVRVDILKARQMGFSTFIAALIFTMCSFTPGKSAVIVADVAEHASNLFRKYRFFYESLPDELRLGHVSSNAKELILRHRGGLTSSIRITVQGESAGRSGTYQFLHLSECAFWKDMSGTLTSLLQTVSSANGGSMVFLETTANGFNDYKRRWDADASGDTPYKALFYPWWGHASYRRKPIEGQKARYPWEGPLAERYGLDQAQIAFYREKYQELDFDMDLLRQEFPSSPDEAFRSTGASVFSPEAVAARKESVLRASPRWLRRGDFTYSRETSREGRVRLFGERFAESPSGPLVVYEDPIAGHPYVCNMDPSLGGRDFTAIQVVDNCTLRQVAVYHARKVDDDEAAHRLALLSRMYNGALVSAETNSGNGPAILMECERCGCGEIYQDKDWDALADRYQDRYGYKTKQSNKELMVALLRKAFRDDPSCVRDYQTLCEMEEFEIYKPEAAGGQERYQASGGAHDDLVMALCGALYVGQGYRRLPDDSPAPRHGSPFPPALRTGDEGMMEDVYQVWD